MKKTKRFLSVLVALVMVFSSVPMTAFATERDTSSLDAFLDNDNLAVVAESLLTGIGDRKEDIVPTILNFVFMLNELKNQAADMNVDVETADAETLAGVLIAYGDEFLAETNLNGELGAYSGLIGTVLGGTSLDLNSVDGIISSLATALDFLKSKGTRFSGDASKFSTAALYEVSGRNKKVITKANGASNLEIVYAIFGFLSDPSNISVIKTVIKGELSLGTVGNLLRSEFDVNEINETMKNLKPMINELLYDNLVATWVDVDNGDGTTSKQIETPYAESMYKSYTSDELLAAALVKLITGEDVNRTTAAATARMTMSQLLGKYGDYVIGSFALEPLNNDLKDALTDLINNNEDLAVLRNVINLDYEFEVSDFNFTTLAKEGIFEGLNDLVVGIITKLVKPAVATELALRTGGNDNITYNLTSFFAYVLRTLATNNDGMLEFEIDGVEYSFDFSGFTATRLADMDLEEMLLEVLKLFTPSIIGSELPADIDSLEKVAMFAAYYAIDYYMVQPSECSFSTDYTNLVYNADGTIKNLSYDKWVDTIGTMAMEVAVYWLDRAEIGFDMSPEQYAAYAADGWTWEDYFEDIVDWALGYIAGFPAVADELSIERGVADGYGPWYKLNVVINELVALNFINGCGDETFVADTYTIFVEKLFPSLLDCDLAEFADILSTNNDPESLFNKSVITGVLDLVDTLLFSLFEHNCGGTATFTKEATETHDGYTGTYCRSNGHYVAVTVTPATGVEEDDNNDDNNNNEEPPVEPTPEFTVGDVNNDGMITPADARLALRAAARLENLEGIAMLAADLDGNGAIVPSEARKILRVAARLDVF